MFPQFIRSRVDHIQLVALCRESDVSKYGFEKFFDVIVRDLNILETDGLVIAGTSFTGSVVAVCGDNLGSHQIGGYIENFSTNIYFCRYCHITKKI